MSTLQVKVPRKLAPLLQPSRYKGAYGGRGGCKSHFFAEQVIVRCLREPTRIVCIREVQNSIKDSVKQLLVDKIQQFGLGSQFEVIESEIRGPNGSLIIFKGMQTYNAENIKSLEAYDIAWVEEAQTFSEHSLRLLRPTLRKDGSELWFSWNPRFKTDPVDKFFRQTPPHNAISVFINWRDNPWLPKTLVDEKDHDFAVDEDNALHVWDGAYFAGQGTILAKHINRADNEGRINDCQYDPQGSPIFLSSDIGFRDTAAWWFWQPKPDGYTVFDYDQGTGMDADDWIPVLQDRLRDNGIKPEKLGRIWLPQDAKAKTFQSKRTSVEKFLAGFGAQKIGITPPARVSDRINSSRVVTRQCEFNKVKCEKGLDGLRAWSFDFDEETGILSKEPKHDWASHPGDAYSYGTQIIEKTLITPAEPKGKTLEVGGHENMSLNELWEAHDTYIEQRDRI